MITVRVGSSYAIAAGTSALFASRSCTVDALMVVGFSCLLNVALRIVATLTPVEAFVGEVAITAGATVSGVGGTTSTRLKFHRSPVGAVSLIVTLVPAVGEVALARCVQKVSPVPVATN